MTLNMFIFHAVKARHTTRLLLNLWLARTFGEYVHTAHGLVGEFDYARYRWRGQEWAIPTTAFLTEDGLVLEEMKNAKNSSADAAPAE